MYWRSATQLSLSRQLQDLESFQALQNLCAEASSLLARATVFGTNLRKVLAVSAHAGDELECKFDGRKRSVSRAESPTVEINCKITDGCTSLEARFHHQILAWRLVQDCLERIWILYTAIACTSIHCEKSLELQVGWAFLGNCACVTVWASSSTLSVLTYGKYIQRFILYSFSCCTQVSIGRRLGRSYAPLVVPHLCPWNGIESHEMGTG